MAARKTPTRVVHPLTRALEAQGMSQRQLALAADVQPSDLCRVLSGERPRFGAGTAVKLYAVVKPWGVTLDDLLLPPKRPAKKRAA